MHYVEFCINEFEENNKLASICRLWISPRGGGGVVYLCLLL